MHIAASCIWWGLVDIASIITREPFTPQNSFALLLLYFFTDLGHTAQDPILWEHPIPFLMPAILMKYATLFHVAEKLHDMLHYMNITGSLPLLTELFTIIKLASFYLIPPTSPLVYATGTSAQNGTNIDDDELWDSDMWDSDVEDEG
jgi:hypothetical protein